MNLLFKILICLLAGNGADIDPTLIRARIAAKIAKSP